MLVQSRLNIIWLTGLLSLITGGGLRAESWFGKAALSGFRKTDANTAFAELKIYDAKGSPIRTPTEDWPGAIKRANDEPEWGRWIGLRRKAVDGWIARRQDRIGWVAGWHHDFVSPKDGSFLTFMPDEPGEGTLHSPSDSQVKLTPKLHAAWVYEFRMRHAEMMVEAARLFRITADIRYAEWATAQLNFYADNYDQWTTHDGVHFMFQSLDEAVILTRWLRVARTLGEHVSADQKGRWTQKLFKPEAQLLNSSLHRIHNIACWQRSAAGQVAIYTSDDELWQTAVEGPFGIREQVQQGITGDYLWYEQSLGYNAYVVKALAPFFEYARAEGRGAGLEPEMAAVENLMLAPLFLRFPNGQLPNPADAGRPQRLSEALVGNRSGNRTGETSNPLAGFWRLYPTSLGLKLLQSEKSWDTLLDPPAAAVVEARFPTVVSRNLESSRMAILRSGPWQVFFHYGQLTGTHSQAEALNYEVFYQDVDISHDPGTTGYGSQFTTEFFRSGLCHNVPLVDGVGQDGGPGRNSWNPGKLEFFSPTNVVASQPEYRSDASAKRSLTIAGDLLLDEVSLTTTDGQEHALGFVMNLQGRVKLNEAFRSDSSFLKLHRAPAFKYWEDVQSMSVSNRASFEVKFEGATIPIEFRLPGPFTVFHALAPDCPPQKREVIYIEARGTAATLNTILGPAISQPLNPAGSSSNTQRRREGL